MRLLVLDGNSILNRAFYGIRLLTTKDGIYTNAIYGFLKILEKLKDETSPEAIAIAFDVSAPTFRHKAFAGYKAQRKGMPEELAAQLPILKELLTALGYTFIEREGFEADDILGTLAHHCEKEKHSCVIATGDKDSLQLVSQNVSVRIASTKHGHAQATLFDEEKIMQEYKVSPKQLIEIKALQGDASDNIPGVAGIGPKGAGELICKFHDIDYIYDNLDALDIKDGLRKKLLAGKESAFLSRMLGTIRVDAPIDCELSRYIPKEIDVSEAVRLMTKLEFFSLIEKMGLNAQLQKGAPAQAGETFRCEFCAELSALKKRLKDNTAADFVADCEDGALNAVVFALEDKLIVVESQQEGFHSFITDIFEDETIKKRTHNFKSLFRTAENAGISLVGADFDTMLAGYLLSPSSSDYDLLTLAQSYELALPKIENAPESHEALAKQAAVLPALADALHEKLLECEQLSLLEEMEIPLSRVLSRMERIGFSVDVTGIKAYGEKLDALVEALRCAVFEKVGYEFNLNSPKQLGEALFEKLKLPAKKKNKTGYSTNAEVLEGLRYEHPVIEDILEYRTLSKIKSTYCDGLLKVVSGDGRIHSNFNQVETRTGRISSTEPNLQNIPIRTDVGRELRRFFCAKEGCVLVDADYSQIELRVLAHLSEDPTMIDAFQNNQDIHTITAAQVLGLPVSMVTPLMRGRAKAVNFGIIYGISAFSLAKDLGVSRKEADDYIKNYLANYSRVEKYMKETIDNAKEQGFITTMFNRRRYLPELRSSNFNMRAFGERVARNAPIQGSAADIIKIAMIKVQERLERENLRAKLILQVHDELIVEAPEEEAEKVARLLKEEMENAVALRVPLVAEAFVGKTWYESKGKA